MIGPVSSTGRAMMASLQQAMAKGMPPDQAIQYVKSMAQQGIAPLADLYSMMKQFERLKQQQVKPPQTPPTIKDQLNILDQQQQMQAGNIQQMQAPAPAPQPMDRGLGAIDAGKMEYPEFAGGGIVAFQEGGSTGRFYGGFGPEILDRPDRLQRNFGSINPGIDNYADLGRGMNLSDAIKLIRNPDAEKYSDAIAATIARKAEAQASQNRGLRAPPSGAVGGGSGGGLPYGGPTSYDDQRSLQNFLDQFYMDQMMQGGKQYTGGIYDMEGNKIGKAGGGVIKYQQGGGPARSGAPIPYTFNDELAARIPSFMKSDMDIISFVKAQMPGFDALPMAQKQEVLRQFEPVYMRAREARNTLVGRNAPEVAAPVAAAPVDMMAAVPALSAVSPFATEDELVQEVLRQSAIRPSERVEPAVEREVTVTGRREAKREPEKDRFEEYRYEKPDLAAIRAEREERQKREKTGAYSQADAELAAYIKEQKEQYGASEKEARNNFWVQTGAALMANKSPYFLQALGESIKDNYGGLVKDLRKLKADTNTLRLEEIKLQQAKERALESDSASDLARYEALQQRYDARQYDIMKTELSIEQAALGRAHTESLARLRSTGNERQADRLMDLWRAANAEKDPEAKRELLSRYTAELQATREVTKASTATGVGADIRADASALARVANLAKTSMRYRRAQDKLDRGGLTEAERLEAERIVQEEVDRAMYGAGGTSGMGGAGGATTFSGW